MAIFVQARLPVPGSICSRIPFSLVAKASVLVILVLSSGCAQLSNAPSPQQGSAATVSRHWQWTLPRQARIYMARAEQTDEAAIQYTRLRYALTHDLHEVVEGRYNRVSLAPVGQSYADSWQAAEMGDYDFLWQLKLIDHSERLSSASEWYRDHGMDSTRRLGRDQIVLALLIYDVRSRRLLDALRVSARSPVVAWRQQSIEALAQSLMDDIVAPL